MPQELAEERPKGKPPELGALIATLLELAMLGCLVHHRSLGVLLALVYFPFSATRSCMVQLLSGD